MPQSSTDVVKLYETKPGDIYLKVHYVVLGKNCESEEKDLHWLILLCLNKLNEYTLFVFMTE